MGQRSALEKLVANLPSCDFLRVRSTPCLPCLHCALSVTKLITYSRPMTALRQLIITYLFLILSLLLASPPTIKGYCFYHYSLQLFLSHYLFVSVYRGLASLLGSSSPPGLVAGGGVMGERELLSAMDERSHVWALQACGAGRGNGGRIRQRCVKWQPSSRAFQERVRGEK